MWKGNGDIITLLFSPKRLEILQQERREEVNTITTEHFNSNISNLIGPAVIQHTYHLINQPIILSFLNSLFSDLALDVNSQIYVIF